MIQYNFGQISTATGIDQRRTGYTTRSDAP